MPSNDGRGGTPSLHITAAWILLAATVVALASAVLHVGVTAARLLWERTLIWHGRDFALTVPVAYVVSFLCLAIPIGGVGMVWERVLRRTNARAWVGRSLVFFGALAVLLLSRRLASWAQLVLAAGVAVTLGSILAQQPTRRLGFVAVSLSVLLGVMGFGEIRRRGGDRSSSLASTPDAPDGAPNVLLIILDTVRAASLSLYGYHRPTAPALSRWAAQGVTFDLAISTSSWTLPSHGSVFTGRPASELSASWRVPLNRTFPTLAEVLRDRGYSTAGFVANTYYAGHDSGLDRGFGRYDDYRSTFSQLLWSTTLSQTNLARSIRGSRTLGEVAGALWDFDLTVPTLLAADRKRATTVTNEFLAWQAGATNRPFFAFLNYFDAHERYYAPAAYRKLFGPDSSKQDLYDASIRYLDDEIDRLLLTLRKRGVLDRTIVVVTSDHGELFGEHNLFGHGNGLFLPLLHVPLVVRYPARVPAGVRVDMPVSLQDLASTILDLAEVDSSGVPGSSLTGTWVPGGTWSVPPPESYLTSFEDGWLPLPRQRIARSQFVHDLHWIRAFDGREALYAYRTDPGEQSNLIGDRASLARLDSLRVRYGLAR